MEEQLELRMYFFTVSSLKGISQGIMCGHCALEYAKEYGDTELYKEFIENHKTWIILNGGTTNNSRDFDGKSKGTLNQIVDDLQLNEITFAIFSEPDLNDALTAVCLIVDERVFDTKKYMGWDEMKMVMTYDRWVKEVGGWQNVVLRDLINNKKLA